MASSADAPLVLDCDPSARPQRYGAFKWVLWPYMAWHVAVPAVRWRGLDLFQHHVLAHADRGVTNPVELTRRLDLGEDLVRAVLRRLEETGFLAGGAPTVVGRRYLEEHAEAEPELIPGYVFCDVFSGTLAPRFLPGALPQVALVGDGVGRFATIDRGTAGRPETRRCRVVWPERIRDARPPTAQRVRQACRAWSRHRDAWQRLSGGHTDRLDDVERLRGLGEGRISILAPEATRVLVSTFLFLPEGADDVGRWQVCDPFGLGTSATLRQQVEQLALEGSKAIAETLDELLEAGLRVDADEVRGARRERYAQAAAVVDRHLGGRDAPHALAQALVQLEAASSARAEALGRDRAGHELNRRTAELVRRAYDACEELFAWVTSTWAPPGLADRLGGSASDNVGLLSEIAAKLGFRADETLDTFGRFLRVTRNQLVGVVDHENRGLPAMVAAALLASVGEGAHPLHEAAFERPGLLAFFDRLKRARDGASHHGATGAPLDADGVVEEVWAACAVLLPRGVGPAGSGVPKGLATLSGAVDATQRLRARAVRRIEADLGLAIRNFPTLRADLIELEHLREDLLIAREDDDASAALRKDVPSRAAAALESALVALVGSVPLPSWVAARSDGELREAAAAMARELKLVLTETDGVLRAAPERVRRAATSGSGTLSTMALLALLGCRDVPGHPFRVLADADPELLVRLASVADRRGHGDRSATRDEALALADDVRTLCRQILDQL